MAPGGSMKVITTYAAVITIAALAACDSGSGDSGSIPDAQPDPGIAATTPAAARATTAETPCSVFTPAEVATLTGARGELHAAGDQPPPGTRSCAWRNRQQEGALLIMDRCDGATTRGLDDPVPADEAGHDEPCFWLPAGQDRVSGIGRDARVHLMTEEGMPSYWVAEALLDDAAIEVWVHEAAGRDMAVEFLQAAADRLSTGRTHASPATPP